jgi:hypothetical protein
VARIGVEPLCRLGEPEQGDLLEVIGVDAAVAVPRRDALGHLDVVFDELVDEQITGLEGRRVDGLQVGHSFVRATLRPDGGDVYGVVWGERRRGGHVVALP